MQASFWLRLGAIVGGGNSTCAPLAFTDEHNSAILFDHRSLPPLFGMSWFKNIFGDSKSSNSSSGGNGGSARSNSSSPPPSEQAKKEAGDSILDLKAQVGDIEKRIELNQLKLAQEEAKIKALLLECGTDEKKKARKKPEITRIMENIRRYKTKITEEEGKRTNLENFADKMQDTIQNVDQTRAMEKVAQKMAAVAPKREAVEKLRDQVEELVEVTQEISSLLSDRIAPSDAVDEDEENEDLAAYLAEAVEEVLCPSRILPSPSLMIFHRRPQRMQSFRSCSTPRRCSLLPAKNRSPRKPRRLLPSLQRMKILLGAHHSLCCIT